MHAGYIPWTCVLQLIPTLLSVSLLTHHLFGYSRSHMFVLPAVAGCQCFWLYPGQQRSQVSPQVLCWHSHWNLQKWKPLKESRLKIFFLSFEIKRNLFFSLFYCSPRLTHNMKTTGHKPHMKRSQSVILEHFRTFLKFFKIDYFNHVIMSLLEHISYWKPL